MLAYQDVSLGRLLAINILGEPFFLMANGSVVKISPETGEKELVDFSCSFKLESLDDYWTARSLKEEWEKRLF